jgi:trk system potassium uptake protein TrkA
MLTLMKLNRGKHSIIQINIKENSKAIGKLVKEINIPSQSVLISLTRNGEMQIPKGNTTIEENDEILILTDDEGFDILEEIF